MSIPHIMLLPCSDTVLKPVRAGAPTRRPSLPGDYCSVKKQCCRVGTEWTTIGKELTARHWNDRGT